MTNGKLKKLYIESSAITEPNPSGIGHNIVATIKALCENEEFTSKYLIVLLVPGDMKAGLDRWEFPADKVKVKSIGIEKHLLQVLLKYNLLLPMDLLIGRGLYLFPNYKNWPLLFSKSITYIYDVVYDIYPETVQPKNLAMLKKHVPRWASRTNFVITITESSKKEIIKSLKLASDKIGVVYCGVDQALFHKRPEAEVNKIKQKYKIKGDYIMYVGNIEPRKNLEFLIDALDQLPSDFRNKFPLVLIGAGGWLNEGVMKKIETIKASGYKVINPKNYVPDEDLAVLYNGATLLVHPAIHEGFGIPPLQAMSSETAVAASNIEAIREIAAENCWYFNPKEVDSLSSVLETLLSDDKKRSRHIKAAKARSLKFNWASSADSLIKYIDLIAS